MANPSHPRDASGRLLERRRDQVDVRAERADLLAVRLEPGPPVPGQGVERGIRTGCAVAPGRTAESGQRRRREQAIARRGQRGPGGSGLVEIIGDAHTLPLLLLETIYRSLASHSRGRSGSHSFDQTGDSASPSFSDSSWNLALLSSLSGTLRSFGS